MPCGPGPARHKGKEGERAEMKRCQGSSVQDQWNVKVLIMYLPSRAGTKITGPCCKWLLGGTCLIYCSITSEGPCGCFQRSGHGGISLSALKPLFVRGGGHVCDCSIIWSLSAASIDSWSRFSAVSRMETHNALDSLSL